MRQLQDAVVQLATQIHHSVFSATIRVMAQSKLERALGRVLCDTLIYCSNVRCLSITPFFLHLVTKKTFLGCKCPVSMNNHCKIPYLNTRCQKHDMKILRSVFWADWGRKIAPAETL